MHYQRVNNFSILAIIRAMLVESTPPDIRLGENDMVLASRRVIVIIVIEFIFASSKHHISSRKMNNKSVIFIEILNMVSIA